MKSKSILFPCGDLTLEGTYYYPGTPGKFPGIVICHPDPLYGGSMNNNIVREVASTLTKHSIVAFTFNFRGVGKSQGSHGNGRDEKNDVAAAIDWLSSQLEVENSQIGLAGYSFGASVALPEACHDPRIKALALISPALLDQPKMDQLRNYTMPGLTIFGSADEYLTVELQALMKQDAPGAMQFEIITAADHFWFSFEPVLAEKVASFFDANLRRLDN